jgi:hypothetical protein
MKKFGIWATAVVGGLVLAEIGASGLYCVWSGHGDAFAWPYDQWILVAPYWRLNWKMTLLVVASGGAPVLILAMIVFGVARKRMGGGMSQGLYGRSGFASPKAMQQNGIRLRRTPM